MLSAFGCILVSYVKQNSFKAEKCLQCAGAQIKRVSGAKCFGNLSNRFRLPHTIKLILKNFDELFLLFGKIFLKQHLFITLTASIEFPIMSVIKSSDLACSEFSKVYCLQPQTTNACYFQILHMRDIFLWFSIILYWNDPQMTPIFSNTYVFQKKKVNTTITRASYLRCKTVDLATDLSRRSSPMLNSCSDSAIRLNYLSRGTVLSFRKFNFGFLAS